MSDERPLSAAERELEAALGALRPSTARIDRDQLMFEAGRQSGCRRGPVVWQVLSGALAAALVMSVSLHRTPREVERVVYVTTPAAQRAPDVPTVAMDVNDRRAEGPAKASYFVLRGRLLDGGTDAIETRRPVVPVLNPRSTTSDPFLARPNLSSRGESL
jgi:hypothetical protein